MRQPISTEQRNAARAMARDRAGIDRRILEIDAEIQHLIDERDRLKAERLTNEQIAARLGICATSVHYAVHGRF